MPSPNPKGRPRGQSLTAELRRQADPEEIARTLLAMISDPATGSRERLGAIALVFDRVEGKALARSVSMRLGAADILPPHFDTLPLEERRRVLADIRAQALAGAAPEPAALPSGDDDETTDD